MGVIPWAPHEPAGHVPYWLAARDPAIEQRHVELMTEQHRLEQHADDPLPRDD